MEGGQGEAGRVTASSSTTSTVYWNQVVRLSMRPSVTSLYHVKRLGSYFQV